MRKLLLFTLQLLHIFRFSFEMCVWISTNTTVIKKWWSFRDERVPMSCGSKNIGCSDITSNITYTYNDTAKCLIISSSNITIIRSAMNTSPELYGVQLNGLFINSFETNAFKNLPNLQELSVSNNTITTLPKYLFLTNDKLKIVDLSYNTVNTISNVTFPDCIEYLNLMHNKLEKLDFHLPVSLINLEISFNMISHICETTFHKTIKLKSLNMSNNVLTTLSPVLFTSNNLFDLDLSHNDIISLPQDLFASNFNLQYLRLDSNNIQTLDFSLPKSLHEINLSFNSISHIRADSFYKLNFLTRLELNNNLLQNLPIGCFNSLNQLDFLSISNNKLKITFGTFGGLTSLRKLYIANNFIVHLPELAFNDLKTLTSLDISYNSISSLNVSDMIEHLNHLQWADLEGNPFKCSYLTRLIAQFKKNEVQVKKGHTVFENNVNGIACINDIEEFTSANDDATKNPKTTTSHPTELKELIKDIVAELNANWFNRSDELQENKAKEVSSYKNGWMSLYAIFQTILQFGVFVAVVVILFIKYTKHRQGRHVDGLIEMQSSY